ncbi:prolyl 3-hydroxylase 2-like [Amblyomma americanum]
MYSHRLTDKEVFTGYRTYDVIEHLRYSAEMATATRVMLAASDRARLFSEAYFQLKRRLYMHLVQTTCRTALINSSTERADMSHPLHADNCQFQENASCPALSWEFSWRDVSAVVYLNDDAHGGEFVFTKTPRTSVRAIVRPKCGRLVAFSGRNCHGVLPVFRGRRCALLVWMTHTKEQREPGRKECADILGYTVANSSDRFGGGF